MASRSIWKGTISFSMLSIPVRLYLATESKDLSFNTLHAECRSRLKQKRWCPVDDREVTSDEVIRAYEWSKDQYVEITDDDLEALKLPSLHTIALSQFVQASEIDPVYFEKSYWLEPEPIGAKPYALLMQALNQRSVYGIATITIRTKEQLCALRVGDGTLMLETLFYPDEIRERILTDAPTVTEPELNLALSLVDTLTAPFVPSEHTDAYRTALTELIAARQSGEPITAAAVAPPATSSVPDLMQMLQASIAEAQAAKAPPPEAIKPLRKQKKGAA